MPGAVTIPELAGAALPNPSGLQAVFPSVLRAIGRGSSRLGQPAGTIELPQARRAVVVLVDGMGFHQLRERIGHAPNLRKLGVERSIRTVAPSTTAAALTSLGTGLMPGQTAVTGYSLRVPGTPEVFNLISWRNRAVDPLTWQTQPTFFETHPEMVKVQPKKFMDSGLTNAGLRGGRTIAAESLAQRVDAAVAALQEFSLVYMYWGDLDAAGHRFGWKSEKWIAELESLDFELGRLARALPDDAMLVITADHGMIDVEERLDIGQTVQLADGVDVVAGEPRAVHLYTAQPEEVAKRWGDYLGERAWVVTTKRAAEAGLLGPVNEQSAKTMGQVLAFSRGNLAIVDSRYQSDSAIAMVGVHGSLTAEEMDIPLIVA